MRGKGNVFAKCRGGEREKEEKEDFGLKFSGRDSHLAVL
jgi:hypothetical protein